MLYFLPSLSAAAPVGTSKKNTDIDEMDWSSIISVKVSPLAVKNNTSIGPKIKSSAKVE